MGFKKKISVTSESTRIYWDCDVVISCTRLQGFMSVHTVSFQRRRVYYSDNEFYTMGSRGCLQAMPITNGATLFKSCKVMWSSHYNLISMSVLLFFSDLDLPVFFFQKRKTLLTFNDCQLLLVTHMLVAFLIHTKMTLVKKIYWSNFWSLICCTYI